MAEVFVLDPVAFKAAFNQFSKLSDDQLQWFFDSIEGLLDNSTTSCISLKNRKIWYWLLVAHKAELQGRIDNGNSSLIGRVSSATEGSVSISSDYPTSTGAQAAWLNQTPYGAEFYALTAPYRTAIWVAGIRPMPINRSRFRFGVW